MNNYTYIEHAAAPPDMSWLVIVGGFLLAAALAVGIPWLLEWIGKKNNRP